MKRLLPGLPSLQRNDVEIQFEVVFILLCSQAQSIKSHFQWVTSLDSNFPSYLLFTHPTVRALNLVLFVPPIRRGIFRLLYRFFLQVQSGAIQRQHVSLLVAAVRYTDCGCLDLRHLYCNINSSIRQHQQILVLLSSRTYATLSVVQNFSPLLGPHKVQCDYDGHIFPHTQYNLNGQDHTACVPSGSLFSSLIKTYQLWYKSFRLFGVRSMTDLLFLLGPTFSYSIIQHNFESFSFLRMTEYSTSAH